jgi:hypothetical protein
MTDTPWFAPGHVAPPKPRQPTEHLWTLRKGAARLDAELRDHGQYGVELQLLREGVLIYGHRYDHRDFALDEAAGCRRLYEKDGWNETPTSS